MKNKVVKFIGLCLVLALTGCLDISETITLNKDGSGEYSYKINAAEMLSSMISMSGFDSTKSPEATKISFDSSMLASLQKFKNGKGLSNFKLDTSEAGVYVVTVQFDKLASLNAVLDDDKSNNKENNRYSYSKGKFTVGNVFNADVFATTSSDEDGDNEESETTKSLYKTMKYSLTVNLPGKVKKSNNKSAEIASDKRTVVFNATFDELMSKEKTTQNVIVFK